MITKAKLEELRVDGSMNSAIFAECLGTISTLYQQNEELKVYIESFKMTRNQYIDKLERVAKAAADMIGKRSLSEELMEALAALREGKCAHNPNRFTGICAWCGEKLKAKP